jgi:ubiquinol oxidase
MIAPQVAKAYYESADMYVFDEFQTNRPRGSRRPRITSLYDVFCNIRDDEAEHVATMSACQDPEILLTSPNTEAALVSSALALTILAAVGAGGEMGSQEVRSYVYIYIYICVYV